MNPLSRAKARAGTNLEEARIVVIHLEGELGSDELSEVGAELFRQVARGRVRVILDLSAVPHLDYRGVKNLSSRTALLRGAGGDVKLVGVSKYLQAILCAGGAHKFFELYASVDAAQAAFEPALVAVA